MSLLSDVKKYIWENARCVRHNYLHLKTFRISYNGKAWNVRDRNGIELRFPFYPYLSLFEIEGYLRQGEWQLKEGMTVVDVGGCLGEFSAYASRCVGRTGRVLMLEPDAENLEKARQLFDFNGGCANVTLIPAGLWKDQGMLAFTAGAGYLGVFVEAGGTAPAGATLLEVPVHSWESLANEFQLNSADLVKMDIEGSELIVMDAAADFIRRFSPRFSIASYHPIAGHPDARGTTSQELEPKFRSMGYVATTGFAGHLTTWAWPTK